MITYRLAFLWQIIVALVILGGRGLSIVSISNLYILGAVLGFSWLFINVSLVVLFVYKLIQVYRHLNEREYNEETEFLMEPITKVTILCSISLAMSLMFCILMGIFSVNFNYILGKFLNYLSTMDMYTNFLCIVLCDKMFKQRYLCLCSFVDKKCRLCWKRIVIEDMDEDEERYKQNAPLPTRQMTLHWGLHSNSVVSKNDEENVSPTSEVIEDV